MPRFDKINYKTTCPYCGRGEKVEIQSRSIAPRFKTAMETVDYFLKTASEGPQVYESGSKIPFEADTVKGLVKCFCGKIYSVIILVDNWKITDNVAHKKDTKISDSIDQIAIQIETIIEVTCSALSLPVTDLLIKNHKKAECYCRYVIWSLMKKQFPKSSCVRMGKLFNRDHASVLHGMKEVSKALEYKYNPELKTLYNRVCKEVFS